MNILIALSLVTFITNDLCASSMLKGIYGDDNRRLIGEVSAIEYRWSRAVLAQIPLYKISNTDESTVSFETRNLQNTLNVCSEEKFASEMMLSSCTGFLVAPDLLVTAGHCVKTKSDCQKNMWLLDYEESRLAFSKEKIVYCKELVDVNLATDYAIIRLSRSVLDRAPLTMRGVGKLNPSADFVVIGHPLGLPKISTDQAFLRGNLLTKTFTITSDTYSGNSGSPVIDSVTGIVEGILVKGDRDFEMDFESRCNRSVHCDNNSCRGETVLRSIFVPQSMLH